jgi:replicative DNA helicase
LNVPVLAAAQLSRAVEQRADKRPQLSDLRESGSLEQDADIVMFIHRPNAPDKEVPRTEAPEVVDLIVAKHRNGPTHPGIQIIFFNNQARFESFAKTNEEVLQI